MATDATCVAIARDSDIITARMKGRELASLLGFSRTDLTLIAAATSEIARNIFVYAGRGKMTFSRLQEGRKYGILIVGRDSGPGIPDIEKAMQDGFSTAKSLGLGQTNHERFSDRFRSWQGNDSHHEEVAAVNP